MDKQPLERSFLIPIGISIFSILGIVIVLLIVNLDKPETAPPVTPTMTAFKYLFLGTETPASEPDLLEATPSEEAFLEEPADPTFIDTPQAGFPAFPGVGPSPVSTLTGGTAVLIETERYDDTTPILDYDGDWESQTNVANAYQGTLSVSNTIGSDLIFSFTGRQMIVGYLGAPELGSLLVSLDDEEFQVNQSAGKEWTSPQLSNTEHFVIIVHDSGKLVNLDYINILNSE